MAQENNPFYIDPLGGANLAQGLAGLGAGLGQMQQKNAALAAREQMVADVTEAYSSQDPNKVASVMIKYPEMRENLQSAIGFKNEATKNNALTTMRSVLSNPEKTKELLESRIEFLKTQGADTKDTEQQLQNYNLNPETYPKQAEMIYANLANEQEWKAYQDSKPKWEQGKGSAAGTAFSSTTGEFKGDPQFLATLKTISGKDLDTAHIRDLEHYKKLVVEDPKLAEKFARMIGMEEKDLKEVQLAEKIMQAKGEEKDLLQTMTGVKKQLTPSDMSKLNDTIANIEGGIEAVDLTVNALDKLLNNENYLDRMSGVSGAIPFSLPGEGTDAQTAFDNFKDNLTLTNLNKMSGVLTDRDIAVLASAASGVKPGMKKETLKNELQSIRARIIAGKEKKQKMLKAFNSKYGDELTSFRNDKSITPDNVEREPIETLSNDDLINQVLNPKQ